MNDTTLTVDVIHALQASQLRRPVERMTPGQQRRAHRLSEPCPPRSLSERRAPLDVAPLALAELLALPGEEWPAVLEHLSALLELRELQLGRRLDQLAKLVEAHGQEPAGITSESVKAECRIELRRALTRTLDLREVRAELAESGPLLRELISGERCPTCLEAQRPECRSGWTQPDKGRPLRLVECRTRAAKNERDPLVHDRAVVIGAGVFNQSDYEKQALKPTEKP